jgi:hypothetical protein
MLGLLDTVSVEATFQQCVSFSLATHMLRGRVIIMEEIVFQVVPNVRVPCIEVFQSISRS